MRAALAIAGTLVVLGYPFAVYFGLSHFRVRDVALLLIAIVAVLALVKVASARAEGRWHVLRVPLAVAGVAGLGAVFDSPAFVLVLPVLTNLVLLSQFAVSLRERVSLVERFARLQHDDLSVAEQAYCRTVTIVWSGFFALNAAVTTALALYAPLPWWTLHTGVLAYVLMGALFTVEYLVRKYRFRRFGSGLHDRVLSRLLPAARGATPVISP